jgi:sulfatase modifying factor 1
VKAPKSRASRRLTRAWLRRLSPWGLVLATFGCREPTQVFLEISTDIECGDHPETGIAIGTSADYETRAFVTATQQCGSGKIGSLVVVPGPQNGGEFAVRVVNGMATSAQDCVIEGYGSGCVVARRIVGFVPHTTLHLPIFIEASCLGVPCDATHTCSRGACVPATIDDPERCRSADGCALPEAESGGGNGQGGEPSSSGGEPSSSGGEPSSSGGSAQGGATSPGGGAPPGAGGDGLSGLGGSGGAGTGGSAGSGGNAATDPIDATEVTRDAYATWLAASPSLAGQPPYCSFNQDYTPGCNWPPGADGSKPVVCVDWCDARAYCTAQGRRLCGHIGGGELAFAAYADASQSQWYAACSSGGQLTYPYGNSYSASACNGMGTGNGDTIAVGSLAGCQSSVPGYEGIYDLSGNAAEWIDSCDGTSGLSDGCRLAGGYWNLGKTGLTCDTNSYAGRGLNTNPGVGFRCCSSP